jgi:hypothetical protein
LCLAHGAAHKEHLGIYQTEPLTIYPRFIAGGQGSTLPTRRGRGPS